VNINCDIADMTEITFKAAQALARVDGESLEALARRCRDTAGSAQACETASANGLAVLSRILEITRVNITLLGRLRACDTSLFEYGSSRNW
jgi:hypothetical protein